MDKLLGFVNEHVPFNSLVWGTMLLEKAESVAMWPTSTRVSVIIVVEVEMLELVCSAREGLRGSLTYINISFSTTSIL